MATILSPAATSTIVETVYTAPNPTRLNHLFLPSGLARLKSQSYCPDKQNRMITIPLVILGLMVTPLLFAIVVSRATGRNPNVVLWAAVGLAIVFVFTGIGHFVKAEEMMTMLPSWVPFQKTVIHASGILEFCVAAGLVCPASRKIVAAFAIVMLFGFLPVNIYAALNHSPMGGHVRGVEYLYVRVPLQLCMIAWAYFLLIRLPNKEVEATAVCNATSTPSSY